ncbi:hypothetical protein F4809DRAFT_244073 [Biscogniauxia mediterranea]|nr:hypothetical protein F4809DRAFT_244073 [Biscogniauxia mediterranea]
MHTTSPSSDNHGKIVTYIHLPTSQQPSAISHQPSAISPELPHRYQVNQPASQVEVNPRTRQAYSALLINRRHRISRSTNPVSTPLFWREDSTEVIISVVHGVSLVVSGLDWILFSPDSFVPRPTLIHPTHQVSTTPTTFSISLHYLSTAIRSYRERREPCRQPLTMRFHTSLPLVSNAVFLQPSSPAYPNLLLHPHPTVPARAESQCCRWPNSLHIVLWTVPCSIVPIDSHYRSAGVCAAPAASSSPSPFHHCQALYIGQSITASRGDFVPHPSSSSPRNSFFLPHP